MTNLKNQTLFKGSGKKNQTYFEDSGTYYKKKFGNVHKKNYMMRGHSCNSSKKIKLSKFS